MSQLLFQRREYKRLPLRVNHFVSEAPNAIELSGGGGTTPEQRLYDRAVNRPLSPRWLQRVDTAGGPLLGRPPWDAGVGATPQTPLTRRGPPALLHPTAPLRRRPRPACSAAAGRWRRPTPAGQPSRAPGETTGPGPLHGPGPCLTGASATRPSSWPRLAMHQGAARERRPPP
jgi:hypothetical protein